MTEFSDFWKIKRRQLANDYVDESGLYAESCGVLAVEIARLLEAEGKTPSILSLRVDSADTNILVPLPYGGRIGWGGHMVCVAEGMVYDPMLPAPVQWDSYSEAAFGEDILATERTAWLDIK